MSVTHIVLFKSKPDVPEEEVKNACTAFLQLKTKCLHSDTGKPYIVEHSGGKNNSPENMEDGLNYAFVMKFANLADRDHYLYKDQAHLDFASTYVPKVAEKVVIVDYESGVF